MHAAVRADAHTADCEAMGKHVELIMDGQTIHSEAELGELGDLAPKSREYVWEVMYENQRGIYILGKSWYSARGLLPSDPSGFTLPMHLAGDKDKSKRKTIKTGYDLETYQTPTPAWVWLTPWMVNMRSNTDEQGWRYNLWFHQKGWKQHSGWLNWWGWVRRREWVRLRALIPSHENDSDDDESYDGPVEEPPDVLSTLISGTDPATDIVRRLVVYPLDRERLEAWTKMLDGASDETKKTFAGLIKDHDTLARICLALVFPASRDAFLVTLVTRGLASDQQCSKCIGVKEQWKSPVMGDEDGLDSDR
ncbi:Sporulation-specific protein 73 [Vanrija pseudolonga]|uniref:Sporulation-specific protein 73 n=1 Tax=Vanrija pseudolonga TaxID=143232 RepID=A0AAF1BLB0_9TREE|nr:Sporulation-specific protein 73 [Vanrija pseudolonga]